MCGISGFFSSAKLNEDAMANSLQHRGPDQQGTFTDFIGDKKLFLAHNRLSILDLSENGRQPMVSEDGNVTLLFNGEIYNFKELKQTHLKEERFFSNTDSEVVLKLYLKKELTFINELNGDFAFAIYDKNKSKLFLIRDRAGVKPLYYYYDRENFAFASEIKAIKATGIWPLLNEDEILNYFVFKYVPQNKTLFKNVYRVPPAAYLEFDLPKFDFDIQKYWGYQKSEHILSYGDASEKLQALMKESTEMRLLSDVPVGNFLSGGLDSSIIASFIKQRKDIIHYCARKNESDLKKEGTSSDFYHAEKLAKEWDLYLEPVDIGSEEANIEMIRKTLVYGDDLIADGSQIPSYLITKAASARSKVILSGMGADELFFGYAGHMLSLLSEKYLKNFPQFMVNSMARINQGKGKFLAYRRYLHKLGKYNSSPQRFAIFNLVGDFERSLSVYKGFPEYAVRTFREYFDNRENIFDNIFRFEMENVLVKNLNYIDRMAMANSVECRVPFLDHRVMELAYQMPREYKLGVRGGFKKILKDSFKNDLPAHIIHRRKAGFGMPLRSIFGDRNKIESLLDISFFSNFSKFSVESIRLVIDNHLNGREDNSSIIYALISFQEWYKIQFQSWNNSHKI